MKSFKPVLWDILLRLCKKVCIHVLLLFSFCFNRNASEDVWLGLTKHPNSSLWNKCRKSRSAEINITLPGQIFYERQCAVLNMSRSSAHSNTLYAERCEGKAFGFVCLQKIGKIPDGKLLITVAYMKV